MSRLQWARVGIVTLCLWALLAALALAATQTALGVSPPQRVDGDKIGAVASEHKTCSKIGIDILKMGGNAADAMVATVLCVGVIGMYHSGMGGGGFMLVRSSNGTYEVVDFREAAPAAAHEHMFRNNTQGSILGGLASAVPGELRGLEYLHTHYGVLSWSTIVLPIVKIARHGFPVSHDLVTFMEYSTKYYDFLSQEPTWAIDFAPNGTRLGLGDTITRERYANTLETIALEGPDAFYTGAIANATIRALRELNGTMTLEDLEDYKVIPRIPVEIEYRGHRVLSCGAPASGAVALSVLKTIEGYEGLGDPDLLNLSTHRLDEAIRFGYGERASLGDPNFAKDIRSLEADMLNSTSSAARRNKISDFHTLNISAYDPSGFESLETHGTSHIVTSDSSGLAISLTTTINLLFGSHLMVPETGIIMNNHMNDFSIPNISNAFGYLPSPSNYIRPRKRPLSSLTPTIVESLSAPSPNLYIVGAAGGSRIITATLQNLWHVLDHNLSAYDALARPRMHDQLVPNEVSFEWGYDNRTVEFMRGRGHEVRWVRPGLSAAMAIRWSESGVEAVGDPRLKESWGEVV